VVHTYGLTGLGEENIREIFIIFQLCFKNKLDQHVLSRLAQQLLNFRIALKDCEMHYFVLNFYPLLPVGQDIPNFSKKFVRANLRNVLTKRKRGIVFPVFKTIW
jgi:hypothetical protein